jgi:hypothetical protein
MEALRVALNTRDALRPAANLLWANDLSPFD